MKKKLILLVVIERNVIEVEEKIAKNSSIRDLVRDLVRSLVKTKETRHVVENLVEDSHLHSHSHRSKRSNFFRNHHSSDVVIFVMKMII